MTAGIGASALAGARLEVKSLTKSFGGFVAVLQSRK